MPAPSAEPAWTNVVNVSEVDPRSVSLIRPDLPQPNVIFDFVSKSPQEVRAIVRQHQGAPVLVMKDGHVLAKAPGCTGHLAWIYHDWVEQRSGESVRRLDITQPNENATRRFFCDRL